VRREVRGWRSLANQIPTSAIRHDALSALDHKRGHIDGAALFSILPDTPNPSLLRLLVAYEIIWDFLDCVNEHGAAAGQSNGSQLHLALIDALQPAGPMADYYRYHPWKDDGGYLRSLVQRCRKSSAELPSFERVRPALMQEAARTQVLAINHELDDHLRDTTLEAWAARELPYRADARWFELTGAASASLTVHALLALTPQPSVSEPDIRRVRDAYFPWISAATTMLDSYVDRAEDAANGDHSYIAHYPTRAAAAQRIPELIRRSFAEAGALPGGERHVLIVACMVAMYLSKDSARQPAMRASTTALVCAGGSLTQFLLPILRLWRITHSQRSA
jgi:tetraprenyl-beta-curcumene synthase